MKRLTIDIETYSSADLSKCGVYKYAEAEDFTVLLFAYSEDGAPVRVIDTAHGEVVPGPVLAALSDPTIEKWAFNAAFERVCLSRWLGLPAGQYLTPKGWRCDMVLASAHGLPLSLEGAGEALRLEVQKMPEGKRLIRKFSVPGRKGQRVQVLSVDPDWQTFKDYCKRDVESEIAIQNAECRMQNEAFLKDSFWEDYAIDQAINDRGVKIDAVLAENAIRIDEEAKAETAKQMQELTGIANPGSATQVKQWLAGQGIETESIGKAAAAEIATREDSSGRVKDAMKLRLALAKSSTAKYSTMLSAQCADGRVRGCFQFYGSRTGRWAGRLVQLQNLPQNHLEDLDAARETVRAGDGAMLEALWGNVPDVLSQLIRTAFIAESGRFIVADYSAIEARVTAWIAGEDWRLKVFEEGGDIYCASASAMFKVPVEKHGINGHLRQKGKIAELALGYGGGVGALTAMGALKMGLEEGELPGIVSKWREASPNIVSLWWAVDSAIKSAINTPGRSFNVKGVRKGLRLSTIVTPQDGCLRIALPSGRDLIYQKAGLDIDGIHFMGLGPARKWERVASYGPKFVENIVQATARDLLMNAMRNLQGRAPIVMHIHDEVVVEADPRLTLEQVCAAMADAPAWAEGLPLRADGYETPYYKKD